MTNQVGFRGRTIILKSDPWTGVCNRCRYVPYTAHPLTGFVYQNTELHHMEYDENDPLANTIELCKLCHRQVKWYDNGHVPPPTTRRGYYELPETHWPKPKPNKPIQMKLKPIKVYPDLHKALDNYEKKGDTYDIIIRRLVNFYEEHHKGA